jgi:hypothetical protein
MRKRQGAFLPDDQVGPFGRLKISSKLIDLDGRHTRKQNVVCARADASEKAERFPRSGWKSPKSQDQQVDDIIRLLMAGNGNGIPRPSMQLVIIVDSALIDESSQELRDIKWISIRFIINDARQFIQRLLVLIERRRDEASDVSYRQQR